MWRFSMPTVVAEKTCSIKEAVRVTLSSICSPGMRGATHSAAAVYSRGADACRCAWRARACARWSCR